MTDYRHISDFYRDTGRLIADGATLRDLYDAMLSVRDDGARPVDATEEGLRSLARSWSQAPSFVPIRLLELFQGLEIAHSDDYVLAVVGHLGGRREQEVRLHLLRHDAEPRDDVFWRIFEVEGGAEISLTNVDKFSREELDWHRTVLQLAGEGTISRSRVLHSCLEALNRDFSAYRAGWFSKTYGALAPTAVEASEDQNLLRLCLGSSATATVSLGAKHLERIHRARLLDAPEFVEACASALTGPKTAAMAVLRVLAELAVDAAAPVDDIVSAAATGIAHPHVDVQRAAVRLLVKLGRGGLARASRSALAPAVAAELLPGEAPVHSLWEGATDDVEQAGIAAALPVRPWSDGDARERFSVLLEFGTSAIELELALAWLASTENAEPTLAPLEKRARRVRADDGRFWIAALVLVALEPETEYLPRPTELPAAEDRTVVPSLVTRLREVASILRGDAPRRQLLATPTDTHGWIDPGTLVDRLGPGPSLLPVDLTQAVLRLRPSVRARVIPAIGVSSPVITATMTIEWHAEGSTALKSDGSPRWTWWTPRIIADHEFEASPTQPALIPSTTQGPRWGGVWRETTALTAAALGLVDPSSTLPLVAVAVPALHSAMSQVDHAAGPLLSALASHPGTWTPETAQVLALGMAAQQADLRAQAAELFAAAIPSRIRAAEAAVGFAACRPAVTLNRWTSSFSDAATIAPTAVIDLLTHLLPELPHDARGVGALLAVFLDESLRHRRTASEPGLREWLAGFTGSSAASRTARAALAL